MRDKKRRFKFFSTYDHTGIEAHLEKMATRGWMLEEISQFGWVYRRVEPRKLHFAVAYFPKADDFDPEPSEAQKTFNDFCEHSGWILATSFNKMQIFYNEREKPIPIETDPVTQVNTIHKAMKKSLLLNLCILLIFCFMLIGLAYKELMENPIDTLLSTVNIVIVFDLFVLAAYCIVEFMGYIIWYKRAKTVAKQGEFLPTTSHRNVTYATMVLIIIPTIYYIFSIILSVRSLVIVIAVCGFLIIAIVKCFTGEVKNGLKSMKVKASTNKAVTLLASIVMTIFLQFLFVIVCLDAIIGGIDMSGDGYDSKLHPSEERYEYEGMTFIAHHDTLPLTVGDLTGEDDNNYSSMWEGQKSLLICQYTADQDTRRDSAEDMPVLKYTITKVKIPATYDLCFNQLYNDYNDTNDEYIPEEWKCRLVEIDAESWKADAAYQVYKGDNAEATYLICWDTCIVEIKSSWQFTGEQTGIIAEKLKGI